MGSVATRRPSRFRAGRIVRSVRFKIILLLLVPLVSLSTLWAFAANVTLGDGLNLRHVNTIQDHLGYPSGALGSALQQERRLSMVFLGSKTAGDRASMESARLVTDRQAELFRKLASDKDTQNVASAQAKEWTRGILRHLDGLAAKRRAIDALRMTRAQAFTVYSETVGNVTGLESSLSTLSDPDVSKDARTQVALSRAREVLSQEDALLSGALAAGRITFAEHVQFTKLVGTQRTLYNDASADLRGSDLAFYKRVLATPEYQRLQRLENRFTDQMPGTRTPAAPGQPPTDPLVGVGVQWKAAVSSILTRFRGLELSATANAAKRAEPIATRIIMRVTLAGVLGLIAVIVSVVLSLWVGRSVIRELNGLRRAALDLANDRLPNVIRRLRRGEEVDVAAEAPPLSFGTEEIDQVGQAFNAARRTAIQSAVEEAALRRSIGDVFLNLARRNQTLLHRQLTLLDAMERRISEPDELEDLFRLDHLATRMRRHAEGLIILSGQTPGRGWRNPVPAVDVARAAAAEVEDYARVTVATMPRVSVAGPAVADLIHLLAELIENATLFSPPETTVQVTGQVVAHGFAIEVEDRGLSMDPATLARANEQLADPPEFDLSNSAQLGLFVVGRLAQRHGIQVTLRTSPYGGTTAIVLLPEAIVVRGDERHGLGAGPLAVTRRGEEALVPVGVIGPGPTGYGSGPDTGPIPLTQADRPPLPQRHSDAPSPNGSGPYLPAAFDHGAGGVGSYGTGSYGTGFRDDDASFGSIGADTGQWPAIGENGSGRPPLPQRRRETEEPSSLQPEPPMPPAPRPIHRDSTPAPPASEARSIFEPLHEPKKTPATEPPPVPPSLGPSPTPPGRKPPLPRRVRQANLAPQLRDEVELVDASDGERSPEELRAMLSSIQKGWLRGRSDAEQATTDHEEEDI